MESENLNTYPESPVFIPKLTDSYSNSLPPSPTESLSYSSPPTWHKQTPAVPHHPDYTWFLGYPILLHNDAYTALYHLNGQISPPSFDQLLPYHGECPVSPTIYPQQNFVPETVHHQQPMMGDAETSQSPASTLFNSYSSFSSTPNAQQKNPDTPPRETQKDAPRYQCPDCEKSYYTYVGLSKHLQFHCPAIHGQQTEKSHVVCKTCQKVYTSVGALKKHTRSHTLPCKCHLCGKAFSWPWLLKGHIRTHTGEKPFSCQYCHRAFAFRSNLYTHFQTHSDFKKYQCTSCSETFSRISQLNQHCEGGCPGLQVAEPLQTFPPHQMCHGNMLTGQEIPVC